MYFYFSSLTAGDVAPWVAVSCEKGGNVVELGSTTLLRWMSLRRRSVLYDEHLSGGCLVAALWLALRFKDARAPMLHHVIERPLELRDGVILVELLLWLTVRDDGGRTTYTHVRRMRHVWRRVSVTRVTKYDGLICSLREHCCYCWLYVYCTYVYSYYMNVRRSYCYRSSMIRYMLIYLCC